MVHDSIPNRHESVYKEEYKSINRQNFLSSSKMHQSINLVASIQCQLSNESHAGVPKHHLLSTHHFSCDLQVTRATKPIYLQWFFVILMVHFKTVFILVAFFALIWLNQLSSALIDSCIGAAVVFLPLLRIQSVGLSPLSHVSRVARQTISRT